MSVTPGAATALLNQAAQYQGQQEALVAVPQGFLDGLLQAIGGKVGTHFGGSTGGQVGQVIGKTIESILPFQVLPQGVPGQYQPQSAGPGGMVQGQQGQQEALVAVPQGFLDGLLQAIGGKVGTHFGGSTGGQIGTTIGRTLESILPFQVLPPQTESGARAYTNGYATAGR